MSLLSVKILMDIESSVEPMVVKSHLCIGDLRHGDTGSG